MKTYYVYILASARNGTLYIGMTNDLLRRIQEHREGVVEGFTKKYHTHNLVYFESTEDVWVALEREKRLKVWKRKWKLRLIEESNSNWEDLYPSIAGS